MPINKKESLIYTTLMCIFMVYFMSVYNLMFQVGVSALAFQLAWNELPLALCVAFILDWFIVSGPAKGLAFRFLDHQSATWKKNRFDFFIDDRRHGDLYVTLWCVDAPKP